MSNKFSVELFEIQMHKVEPVFGLAFVGGVIHPVNW